MHCVKAPVARQAFPAERNQRFPALLLESGSAQLPLKERLQAFLFRNGYFDIYDSALGLPGLKTRYPTTVSTPEALSREGRKKVVAAIQQMVEQGEATLRGLIDSKIILPQAPIGYWEEKENALFWIDQLVDRKIDTLRLPIRARAVVERFRAGEALNFFERLVYQEAKREAICSLCERDLVESDLYGMFQDRYGTRVFPLVLDLYPGFGINIWETNSKGLTKYFSINENQVLATRWLVKQFHKKFRDFTEDEAYAYEMHENCRDSMSKLDWKFWKKIDPSREKDPLTLVTWDFRRHRLKRLIQQMPSPPVPNAVIPAFEERDYTRESFREARGRMMQQALKKAYAAKGQAGGVAPGHERNTNGKGTHDAHPASATWVRQANEKAGHTYEEPPAVEPQLIAPGRKELIQSAYRYIDKHRVQMDSEKLRRFCISMEINYGASKPIAWSSHPQGSAPRLAIRVNLLTNHHAYKFYPVNGAPAGGTFQKDRLDAVLDWLARQPLRGSAIGTPMCEEQA